MCVIAGATVTRTPLGIRLVRRTSREKNALKGRANGMALPDTPPSAGFNIFTRPRPKRECARTSWQKIGGASPLRGKA